MTLRTSNRRIRLLLALSVLVFAGTLARAVWLQAVQAGTLDRIASSQHKQTIVIPAGRGTIFDRKGEPLAIGEQATTVYADPRQIVNPRRVAIAAAKALDLDANMLVKQLADRSRHFVYVKRKADPVQAAALEKLDLAGTRLLRRGAPDLPAARGRGAGARLRGGGQQRPRGTRAVARRAPRRQGRKRDDPQGSARSFDRRDRHATRGAREERLPDARSPAPGPGRAGAARDGARLAGQGGHGDRARSADRGGARDGDGARLRPEPLRQGARPTGGGTVPSPTPTSPARPSSS